MSSSDNLGNEESIGNGPATYKVESWTAICIILFGAVVIYRSSKLGSGWTCDGPGSGSFPFYIGLLASISGIGVLCQSLLIGKRNEDVFVDGVQIKRVLSVLVPAAIYILAVQFIGLYLASAVYISVFMIFLGKFSWIKGVLTGAGVNVWFFLMFEVWFKVPLFKGSLNPLEFLGY